MSSNNTEDLTGRDRMSVNVLASWAGYLVFVMAGFVIPRMIDRHIGQVSLGIWDFSWSLVNYLNLSNLGIGSAVNRYVAMYRARGDVDSLRKTVSTVVVIQLVIALFVAFGTVSLVWALPFFFYGRLEGEIDVASWVLGLLGMSLAVQMALNPYRGVMTGLHRWDLHNAIHAGHRLATAFAMIISLEFGGGLVSLAFIYFLATMAFEILRVIMANRVCAELRIRPEYVEWSYGKKMFLFGVKTIVAGMPSLVVAQTGSVLIAASLGPAALAVFSRPMALVRTVETFISRFTFVLTPSAGAMQGSGRSDELRQFFLDTTRYGVAFTLPLLLLLAIDGDIILQIWMGINYAQGQVVLVLALGFLLPISQSSVMRILMGMNLHGRIGLISLLISIIVFCLGAFIVDAAGWSLASVAALTGASLTVANGIVVPIYACGRLHVSIKDYVIASFAVPMACAVPYSICLILGRVIYPHSAFAALGFGSALGALVLGALYWKSMLPEKFREKLKAKISKARFALKEPFC